MKDNKGKNRDEIFENFKKDVPPPNLSKERIDSFVEYSLQINKELKEAKRKKNGFFFSLAEFFKDTFNFLKWDLSGPVFVRATLTAAGVVAVVLIIGRDGQAPDTTTAEKQDTIDTSKTVSEPQVADGGEPVKEAGSEGSEEEEQGRELQIANGNEAEKEKPIEIEEERYYKDIELIAEISWDPDASDREGSDYLSSRYDDDTGYEDGSGGFSKKITRRALEFLNSFRDIMQSTKSMEGRNLVIRLHDNYFYSDTVNIVREDSVLFRGRFVFESSIGNARISFERYNNRKTKAEKSITFRQYNVIIKKLQKDY